MIVSEKKNNNNNIYEYEEIRSNGFHYTLFAIVWKKNGIWKFGNLKMEILKFKRRNLFANCIKHYNQCVSHAHIN